MLDSHAVCICCTERIGEEESGLAWQSSPVSSLFVYEHRECFLRQVLGSVAHVERRCSCYVKGGGGNGPARVDTARGGAARGRSLVRHPSPIETRQERGRGVRERFG